jgi:hypothetical protein
MVKFLIFLVPLLGLAGGGAAGFFLREPPAETEADAVPEEHPEEADAAAAPSPVAFDDLFVVPVLRDGQTWGHVVAALGVTSPRTEAADILVREPILRDALTEALFLHASLGDFDADFMSPDPMNRLRLRLNRVIRAELGDPDARVLIVSMARQGS